MASQVLPHATNRMMVHAMPKNFMLRTYYYLYYTCRFLATMSLRPIIIIINRGIACLQGLQPTRDKARNKNAWFYMS